MIHAHLLIVMAIWFFIVFFIIFGICTFCVGNDTISIITGIAFICAVLYLIIAVSFRKDLQNLYLEKLQNEIQCSEKILQKHELEELKQVEEDLKIKKQSYEKELKYMNMYYWNSWEEYCAKNPKLIQLNETGD